MTTALPPLVTALDRSANLWDVRPVPTPAGDWVWRRGPASIHLAIEPVLTLSLRWLDASIVNGPEKRRERAARWKALERLLGAWSMPVEGPVFSEDRRAKGTRLGDLPKEGPLTFRWAFPFDPADPDVVEALVPPFTWCRWQVEEFLRGYAGRSREPDLSQVRDVLPWPDDPAGRAEVVLMNLYGAGNAGMGASIDWPAFSLFALQWRRDPAIGLAGIMAAADRIRADEEANR